MKSLIFVAAITLAPFATGNELDTEPGTGVVTQEQIAKSQDLPGTIVVRTSKTDPNDVQVAFLKEKLKPGQKPKKLKFQKVALNREIQGIAYDSTNELDTTSSTSSWAFGWGGWGGGVRVGWGGGWNRGWGGGWNSGWNSGWSNGCGNWCQPRIVYASFVYPYQSYYGWGGGGYNYSNCGWGGWGGGW
jgi:hypothetical protein